MKAVIDAVNGLKGDWPYNDSIVMYFTKGADGYGFYSKVYRGNIEIAITSEQFNDIVSQMETNFGECNPINVSHYKLTDKVLLTKEPTLTYTQEMTDNGELPSVGMGCIAFDGKSETKVTVAHINNKNQFACRDDNGDYFIHCPEDIDESFKPLTPPKTDKEKAIELYILQQPPLTVNEAELIKNAFSAGVSFQSLTVEVK
jgi:hypothetical protein